MNGQKYTKTQKGKFVKVRKKQMLLVQQFYHASEIGNVANAALALINPSRQDKDNCFG